MFWSLLSALETKRAEGEGAGHDHRDPRKPRRCLKRADVYRPAGQDAGQMQERNHAKNRPTDGEKYLLGHCGHLPGSARRLRENLENLVPT